MKKCPDCGKHMNKLPSGGDRNILWWKCKHCCTVLTIDRRDYKPLNSEIAERGGARRGCSREGIIDENRRILSERYDMHCSCCGNGEEEFALHWHHIIPEQKKDESDTMSNWITIRNRNLFIAKIDSVDIMPLCRSCHRKIHQGTLELPAYTYIGYDKFEKSYVPYTRTRHKDAESGNNST